TVRKIAASTSECTSMFWIHSGMAARAAMSPAMKQPRAREVLNSALRENFNLHLLRADVVGNIFGRHGKAIAAGSKLAWNQEIAAACGFVRVPAQVYGSRALELRQHCARAGRGVDLQVNRLTPPDLLVRQDDLESWRFAGDYKGLRLAIDG